MKNIAFVSIALLLSACASAPKTDTSQVSPASQPSTQSNADTARNAEIEARRLAAEKLAAEMRNLQKQSVYFDFDKFEIKPEYRGVIQQQGAFIKANKNDIVTIQGNADERGSEEYNLALGDKRANAARKDLELLGVPATQIKTTSFGNEKPRLTCHEEKCWHENRRDDFAHQLN